IDIENKGHRIREVNQLMWMPFAVLAIASIVIGVVGFAFEGQLHHLFSMYLASSFGIVGSEVEPPTLASENGDTIQGQQQTESHTEGQVEESLELNPLAVIASVLAFGIGGFLGYLFY